jgi:pimeloyl-ACP methyl ester carboxylesterase
MIPVIYLHGFASGPASSKARVIKDRLVAAGARVTVPDLAAGDFAHLTISGQLSVLQGAAGSGPVHLVGSSMGGYLAALFAARHEAVQRLVLLAPAFRFYRRWIERLGPAEIDRWRRDDALEVFHYAEGRMRTLRYGLLEDARRHEDFPDFRQEALIFHGRHDDVVPAGYSEEFAAGRPNTTLEIVDSGHDLLNVLPEIARKTVDFLAR